MMNRSIAVSIVCMCMWAGPGYGQDSVGNTNCLPGDGIAPWDALQQKRSYVVDLANLTTSWGTEFGMAPVVKTSKASSSFFGSLTSAQALSRTQVLNVPLSGVYDVWTDPGFGANLDAGVQLQPLASIDLTGVTGNQFALAFAEFATTDLSRSYNGVVGAMVQFNPADPTRLFVDRIVAATNSCDANSNISQFGLGAVDAYGNVHFRADGFGISGGCGLTNLSGQNLFRVTLPDRDPSQLNVISNDYPGGLFDAAATRWMVRNSSVTHNTPNVLPDALSPHVLGTNFNNEYVRGPDFGSIVSDGSHFATGITEQRGNLSHSPHNCAILGSSSGVAAVLGREADGVTNDLNIFGLDASGSVTGALALELPAVITDPTTGVTNIGGDNEFDHYHGAVAFRGGNGQVALGRDAAGNLLVAAQVDHPFDGGPDWPVNYIAVARIDCQSGDTSWTMAGYNDGTIGFGGTGKPILDGPGGSVIGRMVTLDNVTGGSPFGPSVSAPMIDGGGNVWFLSAVELFDGMSSTFNSALLRAVYDPVSFGYELELVLKLGDQFAGQNSGLNYLVSFMSIAGNTSINPGSAWSQNISALAHAGIDPADLEPSDPRTLGGLIVAVTIIYDADQDGDFQRPCDGAPGNLDQDYNVLLYLGSVEPITSPIADPVPPSEATPVSRYLGAQIPPSVVAGASATSVKVCVESMTTCDGGSRDGLLCNTTGQCTGGGVCGVAPQVGECWWAGPSSSIPNTPDVPLVGAQLFCEASPSHAEVWPSGDIYFFGASVVPGSEYAIYNCTADGLSCSAPLIRPTGTWGNVVPPPAVDFADVSGVVAKFSALVGAPSIVAADLVGAGPSPELVNRNINFADVSAVIAAFAGDAYSFETPSCP